MIIQNFRCFKDRTEIDINNMTVFVGRNDIGKSSILEAMDIFFNDKDAIGKLDSGDVPVTSRKKEIIIGGVFSDFPEKIIIDSDTPTSISDEYLLNSDGLLEIHKKYSAGKLKEVMLFAKHPSGKDAKDLLTLKIDDLKLRAESLKVDEKSYDARISSSIRRAIRENIKDKLKPEATELRIFAEKDDSLSSDVKQIWSQLQEYLPIYRLFQSDRKNEEKDSEIQDPMKFAVKRTLESSDLKDQLIKIQGEVEKALIDAGNRTLKKLSEMNPEIAKQLKPEFKKTSWEKAFDFTLLSDDEIPLDKRGSGVKRLILLNFFRAEAERKTFERKVPQAIFALEEPETSQHPDHQRKLIEAFIQLSNSRRNQIVLTTHSPGIARLISPDSLTLIKKDENNKIVLLNGKSEIYREIAEVLGVLPDIELKDVTKVKLAICVEGKNDVTFLKNICESIPELKNIIDLTNNEKLIILPMGGSALQFWVNNDYLGKLMLNQFHLYDSDIGSDNEHQYAQHVKSVNDRGKGSYACETNLREFENYVHSDIIKECYGCELPSDNWNKIDLPEEIAKYNLAKSESPKVWADLEDDEKIQRTSKIKNQIADHHCKKITKQSLEKLGVFVEVKGWYEKIAQLVN